MEITEDWFPIGSVVNLQDDDGLVLILGYMAQDVQTGRLWDYSGVSFPQGFMGHNEMLMFDRTSIARLFYLGYQDIDYVRYHEMLLATQNDFEKAKLESLGEVEREEYVRDKLLREKARRELDASRILRAEQLACEAGIHLDLSAVKLQEE